MISVTVTSDWYLWSDADTMKAATIETQQQQLSTIIPVRYRVLLYLNIFLVLIDLAINTFSEFLAPNTFGILIIYM